MKRFKEINYIAEKHLVVGQSIATGDDLSTRPLGLPPLAIVKAWFYFCYRVMLPSCLPWL